MVLLAIFLVFLLGLRISYLLGGARMVLIIGDIDNAGHLNRGDAA
jgi:hypothetical protein